MIFPSWGSGFMAEHLGLSTVPLPAGLRLARGSAMLHPKQPEDDMADFETGAATKGGGKAVAVTTLSFEQALEELESIVASLEAGNVPLEQSIAIYERGEALKARCEALLKAAEARVDTITRDVDGKPSGTAPLDPQG